MSTPHLAEHLRPTQTKHSQILLIPTGNSQLLWTLTDETSDYFINVQIREKSRLLSNSIGLAAYIIYSIKGT